MTLSTANDEKVCSDVADVISILPAFVERAQEGNVETSNKENFLKVLIWKLFQYFPRKHIWLCGKKMNGWRENENLKWKSGRFDIDYLSDGAPSSFLTEIITFVCVERQSRTCLSRRLWIRIISPAKHFEVSLGITHFFIFWQICSCLQLIWWK